MHIPTGFQTAGPFNLGGGEIAVIAIVVLILFGGKKLPEMAKGLGEGIKNFKNAIRDDHDHPAATEPKKPE